MTDKETIFIKNIYYMLAYAFQPLRPEKEENIDREAFTSIHNLFASILAQGMGRQLKQGLYRAYVSHQENLPVLRGKIRMNDTIQNAFSQRRLLSCEYDELSENNLHNQIVKSTAQLLLQHPDVAARYKSALKKSLLYFAGVDSIAPKAIPWAEIHFQRHNRSYRMLIAVCQMVLEGMLLTTTKGQYRLAQFVDDQQMSRLYEKFILAYYIKEWPTVKATTSQIPWALDDGESALLPVMQSDITLTKAHKTLIIDAKYYARTMQTHFNTKTVHSANLYQIFTYVKNKEASFHDQTHEVAGMILYAATNEAVQPQQRYQMSGNTICVQTLDLNCPFTEIAAQLDDIVRVHLL
ncbi:MAG: 5-methylcytosine-specific restriction endonuclease system specificity protein McrC [Peptococcaceae bacterium]|nr:5-methylcytosine-specific restriction endonuclease system specificity protein McrC [Peptococcaceae bacterium]